MASSGSPTLAFLAKSFGVAVLISAVIALFVAAVLVTVAPCPPSSF